MAHGQLYLMYSNLSGHTDKMPDKRLHAGDDGASERPTKRRRIVESRVNLRFRSLQIKTIIADGKEAIHTARKAGDSHIAPEGMLAIFADGSYCDREKNGGFGLAFKQPGRRSWEILGYKMKYCLSSIQAELAAIAEALAVAAFEADIHHPAGASIKVFTDSQSSIELLQDTCKDEMYWPSRPHFAAARCVADVLDRLSDVFADHKVEIHWCPRRSTAGTKIADDIASEARQGLFTRELRHPETRELDEDVLMLTQTYN